MFDPMSLWMQGTVQWMKVIKLQQEAYLRMLGSVAERLPHENSKELAREAEALKTTLRPANKPAAPKKQAGKGARASA